MGKRHGGEKRRLKKTGNQRLLRRDELRREIQMLEDRIAAETPPRGTNPLDEAAAAAAAGGEAPPSHSVADGKGNGKGDAGGDGNEGAQGPKLTRRLFEQLPLSRATVRGLGQSGFLFQTEIQRAVLPHALAGRDVLASARTGSGKTLAFVVTVLERLYRLGWVPRMDGVGALILTPTRELALQIFNVFRQVGAEHDFSAGLVVGGKDLAEEQARIAQMNILVCTPGRLLQHLEQTPNFDLDTLRLLVLDEADRLLDLGFQRAVDDILRFCPEDRQTMLFSATLSRSIRALSRVSLHDPEHLFVHERAANPVPDRLVQAYVPLDRADKLNVLWSFITTHPKAKMLVFFASCKQVRYVYESFRQLRCGVPVFQLHGKMSQTARTSVYASYAEKNASCLFCTDIAARGLDFPGVQWVIQVDCPEDADTYVHRVGRTARYDASGNALLLLSPDEEAPFLAELALRGLRPAHLTLNPDRQRPVTDSLLAVNSEYPELKYLAQKAVVSYMRSVFLASNKAVFRVDAIDSEALARSYGLLGVPRVRFVRSDASKEAKNLPHDQRRLADAVERDELVRRGDNETDSRIAKLLRRRNADVLSDVYGRLREPDDAPSGGDGDDSEVLAPKRRRTEEPRPAVPSRIAFSSSDSEGDGAVASGDEKDGDGDELDADALAAERAAFHNRVATTLRQRDVEDKDFRRDFRRDQRRARRNERRDALAGEGGDVAVLASASDGKEQEEEEEEVDKDVEEGDRASSSSGEDADGVVSDVEDLETRAKAALQRVRRQF